MRSPGLGESWLPQRATRLVRPGSDSTISDSMPTSARDAATYSAALRSPGPESSP